MLTPKNISFKRKRIVRVLVTYNNTNYSYGTGFFVDEHGLILTCAHVVLGGDFRYIKQDPLYIKTNGSNSSKKAINFSKTIINNIQVELENGDLKNVAIETIDPEFDIATLKVTDKGFITPHFALDFRNKPNLGEEISFYGFPSVLGYAGTDSPFVVNKSIISTFPVVEIAGSKYEHMQINATTIGGVSGAPIFKGNDNTVIGIINGNFHWIFDNIVKREQNVDSVYSTRVPLGIGYATALKTIEVNTSLLSKI